MDNRLYPQTEGVRLTQSPKRSPKISHALSSPVRSVHPEVQGMESIHSQTGFSHRTADFFDDTSEDEYASAAALTGEAPNIDLLERRGSAKKRHKPPPVTERSASPCDRTRTALQPDAERYQRLTPNAIKSHHSRFVDTPDTSFNGSVNELLPEEEHGTTRFSRAPVIRNGRTPRSSAQVERSAARNSSLPSTKVDQIFGAHAIAHEITLHALMRDEDALDRSLQTFASMPSGDRNSLLPPSLRLHDPRSPRIRTFSTPPSGNSKRAHVVPPPINTSGPYRSLPVDIVRTPYPFSPPDKVYRKDFGHSPQDTASSRPSKVESILVLSIKRGNMHSRVRVASLVIPSSDDFSVMRSRGNGEKQQRFKALDFDDAELFRQLRRCYRELSGVMRFFSARSLTRIAVSGPATRAADLGYSWLHQPRSPRVLAYKGLNDTFSEEKILQHYKNPGIGKSRYAFVHWAHRLAAAPPVPTPQLDDGVEGTVDKDLVRRMEQPEGLEFIVSWSVLRILLSLCIVIAASIVTALLWIFLGRNTATGQPSHGGFRDAGDRVAAGVLLGIGMLLLGLSGIAGWIGVSWLIA